jgi:hypothetical protein
MKTKFTLLVLFTLVSGMAMAQIPTCPPATAPLTLDFKWSTSPGTGNEIPQRAAHGNFTSSPFPSGIGYTTTVTLRDPNNRLTIQNYQTDPLVSTHPPYTFCYSSTNATIDNNPGSSSIYSGYYMLGMFSNSTTDTVEIEFSFNGSVEGFRLCNLEISDIDFDASCTGFCSYQDRVVVSATNKLGQNVSVKTTNAAAFTEVTTIGQTITANWFAGTNGDVSASSNIGKVYLSTDSCIRKLVIRYSNGTADDGQSNDHHIRISGVQGVVCPETLPVQIVDFNAINNNGAVAAALQVANQQNIDYYQLQKSIDGRNFTDLGASQRASAATNYYFMDATPANGANFYRVRVKERSGEEFYSVIKRVDIVAKLGFAIKSQGQQVILQANSSDAAKINVTVVNAAGKSVMNSNFQLAKGVNLLPLEELDRMPSGLYFIMVTENGVRTFTGKAVK